VTITAGQGLVINISYDSSVDLAPAGFKTAIDAAVAFFETTFTNKVTLNIQVGFGEVAGIAFGAEALGESLGNTVTTTYAQIRANLPAANLPAADPTGGGTYKITDAQAKLWGLRTDGSTYDGAIGITNLYSLTYDPNNRAVYTEYDAIGVMEHEISEVMGRTSRLGQTDSSGHATYTPLDLFRYYAPGLRALGGSTAYFSPDGQTIYNRYNAPGSGGDIADWDASTVGDSFGVSYSNTVNSVSAADIAEMVAIGYSTVPAAPAFAANDATVTGAGGTVLGVAFADSIAAAAAQPLLNQLNTRILAGSLVAAPNGTTPALAAGTAGMLQIAAAGTYSLPTGYAAAIDTASAPVTLFGGASAGQIVVAGTGGLAFNAGAGAGTVIAGGGNNLISVYQGAGNQVITTGAGNDTVTVLTGANTIAAGAGNNLILAQGGNDQIASTGTDLIDLPTGDHSITTGTNAATIFVGTGHAALTNNGGAPTLVGGSASSTVTSSGAGQFWLESGGGSVTSSVADTIIAGSGAATVNAGAAADFVFGGSGPLSVAAGGGTTTILGGQGANTTITSGTGGVIALSYDSTSVTTGAGAATIAAFGGSVTVAGGAGGGVFLGGPAGNNRLTAGAGSAILIGGGDQDVLSNPGIGSAVLQAGAGAETLTAAGSTGNNRFYGGSGPDQIILGNGNDQVLAGSGNATISAGAGQDLIALTAGNAAAITIQGFVAGRTFLSLNGFAANAASQALGAATISPAGEAITLADGTKILFAGVQGVGAASFL
jgi:Ca2+-binding RTX toxin-like protein